MRSALPPASGLVALVGDFLVIDGSCDFLRRCTGSETFRNFPHQGILIELTVFIRLEK